MSVGFKGEVDAQNLNLGVVMVFKARGSDERNNRAFDNSKEVPWRRIKNRYGLRLLEAGRGNQVKKC